MNAVAEIKQSLLEMYDLAKYQFLPFVVTISALGFIYIMTLAVPSGFSSYLLSLPPAVVIAITALARVNDIGMEYQGWRWNTRRIGLILAGVGGVMIIAIPFTESPIYPSWRTVIIIWGVALAWFTTHSHPPWEDYITGAYRDPTNPKYNKWAAKAHDTLYKGRNK